MDRLRAGHTRSKEDRRLVEITPGWCGRPDRKRTAFARCCRAGPICLGCNTDRAKAEFLAGPFDPDGDFSSIGDEDGLEWMTGFPGDLERRVHHPISTSGSPKATSWPSAKKMRLTIPPNGAEMVVKTFIASTMQRA
ncbi:hypothetical protein D9M72_452760 [compost metagenome]